jgi:hypothetical protein
MKLLNTLVNKYFQIIVIVVLYSLGFTFAYICRISPNESMLEVITGASSLLLVGIAFVLITTILIKYIGDN